MACTVPECVSQATHSGLFPARRTPGTQLKAGLARYLCGPSSKPIPVDIHSSRLVLKPMDSAFLAATVERRPAAALSALAGFSVPEDWREEVDLAALRLSDLQQDSAFAPWSLRAVVLRDEDLMIGHAGFHTTPAPDYLAAFAPTGVELGYAIYPVHRRRGYAREAMTALVRWAHVDCGVTQFVASVQPDNTPSLSLLCAAGFVRLASFIDPVDGLEDVMRLDGDALMRLIDGA